MSYFSVRGLSVKLPRFELSRLSFSLNHGEVLVLLGPSGSGKTVLLDSVAGFHSAVEGGIELDGEDITSAPPETRGIGYVFQSYALFPHMSVEQNVGFALRGRAEARRRTNELLDFMDIRHLAKRKPGTLSGGERQRVALARALGASPRLLLFDEPLSAVDALARETLRDDLRTFLKAVRTTSLYVTHDRTEAMVLADSLAVIKDGAIRQSGRPEEVLAQPVDSWVAQFLGMEAVRPDWIEPVGPGAARIGIGEARLIAKGGPAGERNLVAVFRPENALVSRHDAGSATDESAIKLTVKKIVPLGPLYRVDLTGAATFTTLVLHREYSRLGLQPGDSVDVHIEASDLLLTTQAEEDHLNQRV